MYKYLSIALAVLLLGAGVLYAKERWDHGKTRVGLTNEIAKLEGVVQETETVSSRRAIELEDLESKNDELQQIIEDRNEEILASSEIALKWKDSFFKIKNAKQSLVDEEGNEVVRVVEKDCHEDHFEVLREKVEFEHEEPPVKIKGFTLTNPAYAEVKLEWTEDLKLELNLTRDEDGNFRVYADPGSEGFQIADVQLKVDPSILERAWYEKLAFNFGIAAGDGGFIANIGAGYDIFDDWNLGAKVYLELEPSPVVFFGASATWYPFREVR